MHVADKVRPGEAAQRAFLPAAIPRRLFTFFSCTSPAVRGKRYAPGAVTLICEILWKRGEKEGFGADRTVTILASDYTSVSDCSISH